MGIGPDVIALYEQLYDRGDFQTDWKMLELGDQEISLLQHGPVMKDFLIRIDRSDLLEEPHFGEICHGRARRFYESIGMDYTCIDTDTREGAIFFDLNTDEVSEEQRGQFDLVTNFGTSEHVFNQHNVFKATHDFTKTGGLMVHYLPFLGYVDHGYYSFQPCVFLDLAAANDYEILGIWINPHVKKFYLIPWTPDLLEDLSIRATDWSALLVIMRKKSDAAFSVPFQGRYAEKVEKEGFSSQYRLIANGMKGGLASGDRYLDQAPIRKLVHTILYRFRRKLRRILPF